ncbi:hypothetical protein DFJ74DRAFT_765394 [Hyaloraphidium curvatum]|nr:hypothetical protein DFJ74DRAFT_765394 [Hyaloraphidium curvatum]
MTDSMIFTKATARKADQTTPVPSIPVVPKTDPNRTMKAVEWLGTRSVDVASRPVPMVTHPKDTVVRITQTAICGSDLHLYNNMVSGMVKGDTLGHEFMGIVEAVGEEFCRKGEFTLCDTTNDSELMEKMYGHRTAGIYGYTHMLGGYQGGQAEYNRVPFADVALLPIPDHLKDEQVVLLSDVVPTAFHATEMADVQPGDTVAIFGAGPIGLMTALWCKWKKAARVIVVESVPERLAMAREKCGAETVDIKEHKDVVARFREIYPGEPDSVIDATGFRYALNWSSKIQLNLMLETDSSDVLNKAIKVVRKGGHVSLIADYIGYTNAFNIGETRISAVDGAVMEKGLIIRGGQAPVQRYWKDLLKVIERGEIDPTVIITHPCMNLEDAPKAYKMFDDKSNGCVKCVITTEFGRERGQSMFARKAAGTEEAVPSAAAA